MLRAISEARRAALMEAGEAVVRKMSAELNGFIGCYLRDREDDGVRTGSGKLLILLLLNVLVIIGWTYAEFAVSDAPINA